MFRGLFPIARSCDSWRRRSSSPTTMILSTLAPLLLLPFASAAVHKLKLQKLPQTQQNPSLEAAYLAEKYGGRQQVPMMGAGGSGRQLRLAQPSFNDDGEETIRCTFAFRSSCSFHESSNSISLS